jgi:hypothetical protein
MKEQPVDQEKALEREVEEQARRQRRTAKSAPAESEVPKDKVLDRRNNKDGLFSG